jgi:hypothetical protein
LSERNQSRSEAPIVVFLILCRIRWNGGVGIVQSALRWTYALTYMLDIDLRQGWEEERMEDEFIVERMQ